MKHEVLIEKIKRLMQLNRSCGNLHVIICDMNTEDHWFEADEIQTFSPADTPEQAALEAEIYRELKAIPEDERDDVILEAEAREGLSRVDLVDGGWVYDDRTSTSTQDRTRWGRSPVHQDDRIELEDGPGLAIGVWLERTKTVYDQLIGRHPSAQVGELVIVHARVDGGMRLTEEDRAKMLDFLRANHPITPTDSQEAE